VRTCIIFNPTAKGDKARRLPAVTSTRIGTQATLKLTTAPGDARRLAAEAVDEGFEAVVAAGGDGTVNEVLNGFGDASDGFEHARLGVFAARHRKCVCPRIGNSNEPDGRLGTIRRDAKPGLTCQRLSSPRMARPRAGTLHS